VDPGVFLLRRRTEYGVWPSGRLAGEAPGARIGLTDPVVIVELSWRLRGRRRSAASQPDPRSWLWCCTRNAARVLWIITELA
jgi:hypothetical protein